MACFIGKAPWLDDDARAVTGRPFSCVRAVVPGASLTGPDLTGPGAPVALPRLEGDRLALPDVFEDQAAAQLALVKEILRAVFPTDEPVEPVGGQFLDGALHDAPPLDEPGVAGP